MLHQAGEQFKSQQVEQGKLTQAEVDALPTPYPVATLDIPVYLATMTHAEDRALRQTLYTAYVTRASELSEQNKDGKPLDNGDIRVKSGIERTKSSVARIYKLCRIVVAEKDGR